MLTKNVIFLCTHKQKCAYVRYSDTRPRLLKSNEKSHVTPVTSGEPFVVACLVDFREKSQAETHSLCALSNATTACGKWNEKTNRLDVALRGCSILGQLSDY